MPIDEGANYSRNDRTLYNEVDRFRFDDTGDLEDDQQFRMHVLALAYARKWAARSGLLFRWSPSKEFSRVGDGSRPHRLCRVDVYHAREHIGTLDENDFDDEPTIETAMLCEAEFSLAFMGYFSAMAAGAIKRD